IGLLVGSVRYLVVISSQRSNQPQLIRWCLVENERGETTDSRSLVVKILRVGSFEPEVRAVAGNAPIPRETIGVIAEADLVVCVVVAAITRDQFSLAASLKPRAGYYVEDAIGAVAIFRVVTSPLYFEVIDILGVELRSNVGRNVCVGNGNTIKEPCDLMPTANVQLIVDHHGTR